MRGDFDLSSLNDEELTEQVHDDLYNGLKTEVEEATRIFLKRGWSAERVLNDALVEGMRIVGIDFRDGILFVPEVLLAANSMKGGMEILRQALRKPVLGAIGKIVIGTVKGEASIGKNLVSMMPSRAPVSRSSISASTSGGKISRRVAATLISSAWRC